MTIRSTFLLAATLALATAALPSLASAQVETMRRDMHDFFDAEVGGSWAFTLEGFAAAGAATSAFFLYEGQRADLVRGWAIPVAVIGIVQAFAGGVFLLARTPGQVADLDAQLARDPAAYRRDEIERMERIDFQFDLVKVVEIGLAIAGAGVATYGMVAGDDLWTGIGLGTISQVLVTLFLDMLAAARADTYAEQLDRFDPTLP